MSGFVKIDCNILYSSIWAETPETKTVWITMLALANQNGIVPATAPGISLAAVVPLEATRKALVIFESPDPDSKSLENKGKRIERVEGGYKILNYESYRAFNYSMNPAAVIKRNQRAGIKNERRGYIYFAKSNDRIKIGFSQNPWTRVQELKVAVPDLDLIGVLFGNTDDEIAIHEKFKEFNISREWFSASSEIINFVNNIKEIKDSSRTSSRRSASASASASASESKSIKIKTKIKNKIEDFKKIWFEQIKLYMIKYPGLDYNLEREKIEAWIDENPRKALKKKNWNLFIHGWLGRTKPQYGFKNQQIQKQVLTEAEKIAQYGPQPEITPEDEAEFQRLFPGKVVTK